MFKPESIEENEEVLSILKRNGINSNYFIRISDKDEKLEESYECSKLYDNILFSLRKYM